MMRAAVLPAVGAPLELVERPIPEPGSGEVRVRIQACGVCGSDLFLQNGGFGADKLPVVPGHEAAGVVDSVGPDVTAVTPGDQVALYYIENAAGAERPNLGPAVRRMGVDVDGAFAEYVVRPASTLDSSRPLCRAGDARGPHGRRGDRGSLRCQRSGQAGEAEDTVLVLGIGGIGSNAVQVAKAVGARVVAVSRSEEKRRARAPSRCRRGGRARGCRPGGRRRRRGPHHPVCGVRFDGWISCDRSRRAMRRGRIVFVATTPEPFSTYASTLVWRELTLLGSRALLTTSPDIEGGNRVVPRRQHHLDRPSDVGAATA